MARVNEAWHVLSDPATRHAYDETLLPASAPAVPAEVELAEDGPTAGERRRWPIPLPWLAVLVAVLVIFVFTAYAVGPGGDDDHVDGVLRAGSCVRLDLQSLAFEVPCDRPHYGVVEQLLPFDAHCPPGTESHPDQGGQGLACVTPAP